MALVSALLLAACGGPFVDARREAGQVGTVGSSTAQRVVVCYSSWSATPQEVLEVARLECSRTGTVPVLVDQADFFCSLTRPTTATFDCRAGYDAPAQQGYSYAPRGYAPGRVAPYDTWDGPSYGQADVAVPPQTTRLPGAIPDSYVAPVFRPDAFNGPLYTYR